MLPFLNVTQRLSMCISNGQKTVFHPIDYYLLMYLVNDTLSMQLFNPTHTYFLLKVCAVQLSNSQTTAPWVLYAILITTSMVPCYSYHTFYIQSYES